MEQDPMYMKRPEQADPRRKQTGGLGEGAGERLLTGTGSPFRTMDMF